MLLISPSGGIRGRRGDFFEGGEKQERKTERKQIRRERAEQEERKNAKNVQHWKQQEENANVFSYTENCRCET